MERADGVDEDERGNSEERPSDLWRKAERFHVRWSGLNVRLRTSAATTVRLRWFHWYMVKYGLD